MRKSIVKRFGAVMTCMSICVSLLLMLPVSRPITASALSMTYTPTDGFKSSSYYSQLMSISLSSDQRMNLVRVAESQIGYHEGDKYDQYDGYSSGSGNVCEYNYWYYGKNVSGDSYPWCAVFVSWCAEQAGLSDIIPSFAYCPTGWSTTLPNAGAVIYMRGEYTPQAGDIIFFKSLGHVGIVSGVSGDTVYTIEGNGGTYTCDVNQYSYSLSNSKIYGYAVPNYNGSHDCYDHELDIPYCRPSGSSLIQKGSKGHYVGWVQTALERLGYDVGGVDCDFGSNTDSAVRAFQSDNGLEVDGQVGPATIAKIIKGIKPPVPDEPSGPILSEGAGQTLPDGDYFIYSNLKLNYYLDIDGAAVPASAGTNVHMWTASRLPTSADAVDAWTIKYLGNGFYKIMQKGTNLCLDVQGGSQKRGTNVQVWTEHDDTPEQWSIAATDTGYTIRARCGGYYLDI